jgi:hypothetical protein
VNFFEKEINDETIRTIEKQPTKKRPNVPTSAIFVFIIIKEPFNKDYV